MQLYQQKNVEGQAKWEAIHGTEIESVSFDAQVCVGVCSTRTHSYTCNSIYLYDNNIKYLCYK